MIATLAAFVLASPPSYADTYSQAVREGRPMVVFVGVPSMPGPWLSHECQSFPGVPGKGVILSRPHRDGYMEWVDTLDWWTDAAEIERRVKAMAPPPRKWTPYPIQSFVAPSRQMFSGGASC